MPFFSEINYPILLASWAFIGIVYVAWRWSRTLKEFVIDRVQIFVQNWSLRKDENLAKAASRIDMLQYVKIKEIIDDKNKDIHKIKDEIKRKYKKWPEDYLEKIDILARLCRKITMNDGHFLIEGMLEEVKSMYDLDKKGEEDLAKALMTIINNRKVCKKSSKIDGLQYYKFRL